MKLNRKFVFKKLFLKLIKSDDELFNCMNETRRRETRVAVGACGENLRNMMLTTLFHKRKLFRAHNFRKDIVA